MRKGDRFRSPSSAMARLKGLWTILGEVEEPVEREDLALVATTIQVHFANVKARERAIVEFMAVRFRRPASPTRPRASSFVHLGAPRSARDLAGKRPQGFEVVCRPHIARHLTPELGAG